MRAATRSLMYTLHPANPFTTEIAVRSVFGDRYLTPKHDDIGRGIVTRGIHEPLISHWVRGQVRPAPDDLVIDVGANFGYYAVLFARLGTGRHTVLAFEPQPYNHDLLARNIEPNGVRNAVPFRLALGDRSERRDLVL